MTTYAWNVESIDTATGTMVVKYTHGETETLLNLPVPKADADVAAFVDQYAPRSQWALTDLPPTLTAGLGGSGTVALPVVTPPARPSNPTGPVTVNSLQEEYIRALVFQVLEEIKAAQV